MNIKFIRTKIRSQQYDLSAHAHRERQEEEVTTLEIEQTLLKSVILEKYPEDPRGKSCLVAGKTLHVICGLRKERLLIVTVYRPKQPIWIDYKTRAKEVKNRA